MLATRIDTLRTRPPVGTASQALGLNPRAQGVLSFAHGLAAAEAAERISDEHVLLAMAYEATDSLVEVGAVPDEVCDMLAARGVHVPARRPPNAGPTSGPRNPLLCVSRYDLGKVVKVLRVKHPPGTYQWGLSYFTDDNS